MPVPAGQRSQQQNATSNRVQFELSKLTEEQLKCLLFVCGLREERDVDVRTRLLARIEDRADITLQQLSEECNRIAALKRDSAMIEAPIHRTLAVSAIADDRVLAVHKDKKRFHQQRTENTSTPKYPCWLCGDRHWVRDCPYRQNKCTACGKTGHKAGFCNSFRKRFGNRRVSKTGVRVVTVDVRSVRKLRKNVTLTIMGVTIEMQLDTASDITIIHRKL